MITYIDSSTLTRAYLVDEPGHAAAAELLTDPTTVLVTGTWTRIEVSGALVRATRATRRRRDPTDLLDLLDADMSDDGPVTVVRGDQDAIEAEALSLVRTHGLRAMDAWHLAVASLLLPQLVEPGDPMGFATSDDLQGQVARALGFSLIAAER